MSFNPVLVLKFRRSRGPSVLRSDGLGSRFVILLARLRPTESSGYQPRLCSKKVGLGYLLQKERWCFDRDALRGRDQANFWFLAWARTVMFGEAYYDSQQLTRPTKQCPSSKTWAYWGSSQFLRERRYD